LARRYIDPSLKVAWVDLEEQIPPSQLLIVSHRNVDDRTRYSGGDPDDIRAHLAISGPGILNVSGVEGNRCPDRQANNDQRD
jgi:hypothetical protein